MCAILLTLHFAGSRTYSDRVCHVLLPLSLPPSFSVSFSLSFSCSFSLSLSISHSLARSFSLSLSPSLSLSRSLSSFVPRPPSQYYVPLHLHLSLSLYIDLRYFFPWLSRVMLNSSTSHAACGQQTDGEGTDRARQKRQRVSEPCAVLSWQWQCLQTVTYVVVGRFCRAEVSSSMVLSLSTNPDEVNQCFK